MELNPGFRHPLLLSDGAPLLLRLCEVQMALTLLDDVYRLSAEQPRLTDDASWREECGACHLAFHPNLLPERSWRALIAGQADHFGSDLALDISTQHSILSFLVNNAAEKRPREAAFKINRSIEASATPLRIGETPYWVDKHADIASADWQSPKVKSKANCAACHLDAEAGTFEDSAMPVPR